MKLLSRPSRGVSSNSALVAAPPQTSSVSSYLFVITCKVLQWVQPTNATGRVSASHHLPSYGCVDPDLEAASPARWLRFMPDATCERLVKQEVDTLGLRAGLDFRSSGQRRLLPRAHLLEMCDSSVLLHLTARGTAVHLQTLESIPSFRSHDSVCTDAAC